jgi:hypothetical protein
LVAFLLVVASVVGCGPPAPATPSSADLATAIVVQLATDVAIKASETPVPPTSTVASAPTTAVMPTATPFPPSPTAAPTAPATETASVPTALPPTAGPSNAPTSTPIVTRAPAPAGPVVAKASVSSATPHLGSTVTVFGKLVDAAGKGVSGAMMHTVWNDGATTGTCDGGSTDASGSAACSRQINPATPGHVMTISVAFTLKGQTYRAQTSFTPQ